LLGLLFTNVKSTAAWAALFGSGSALLADGIFAAGVTSTVYLGQHRKTSDYAAVKILSRARISFANFGDLAREVSILKKLRHQNIIGLKDVYITEEYLQIVMELYDGACNLCFCKFPYLMLSYSGTRCRGRELFDVIVERHTFTEIDAKELVKAVLEPIAYLHSQGIVHRHVLILLLKRPFLVC
jgi:serine/threonine protein kinase